MTDLDTLADEIKARGVTHIFGIPGSGASLTLIDALERRGIPFRLNHFEGSGVLMAGAMGRLSGKCGVVIGIKGPGLANMLPGIAACRLEAFPLVSISEAYPPGTPLSRAHKRLDHRSILSGAAKGTRFFSINGPGFSDMAQWAEEEVPGPVHMDFSSTAVESDAPIPDKGQLKISTDSDIQKVISMVSKSNKPVIIAGTYAIRKRLSTELNKLSIPAFSVAAAKGVIDETLPNSAGVYTGAGLEMTPESSIIPAADLVIGIGLRHNEVLEVRNFGCKSINFDPVGREFCDGFGFDYIFDAGTSYLERLFAELKRKSWGIAELSHKLDSMVNHILRPPFMPARIFHGIEQYFDHNARIVLDTGNFCTIGEHILKVRRPEYYLSAGQGRYMGIAIPLSLGAAMCDPGMPTVVFTGDGGIGMFLSEVKLAVKHKLPLIIVLMSDGYLGSIRVRSIADHITEKPVTIHQPSWCNVFRAFGINSVIIQSESDIEEILDAWRHEKGPLFMEAHFDPEGYQRMTEGIR
ncbi:MAG: thiamine pyrophosphate-binding protein [Deltaproteobacteria bacterium]|nr:thiamine pyrophosphate-binding protein [Deltaproteobacteria bacterium]